MTEDPSGQIEHSPELPKLDPGLRWSPDPDSDEDKSPSQKKNVIVAPRPGLYRIDASTKSPLAPIGNSLRSTFGIVVGGGEFDPFGEPMRQALPKKGISKGEIDEEHGWIPYQELRAPINPPATITFTPNSSRSSKYQAYIRLPSEPHTFIAPTPEKVLHYMLESVEEFHSDVYGTFLHQSRDSGLDFQSLLRPEALRVLSSGNHSRENLLQIRGNAPKAGIYLHILWLKSDPSIYFLYIGQSIEIPTRLANHRDHQYRAKHPSLHYFVWDRGNEDKIHEVEEEFVFLSETMETVDPLLLNLLEMWCCLMLQTLTKNALVKYLPANTVAPYAGTHLNIAIPLYQAPFRVMVDTQDPSMYHTSNQMVARYYASLRRRFYELKFSPNVVLRSYYAKVIQQRVVSRVRTNQKNLIKALDGVERFVSVKAGSKHDHQRFHLSHFTFNISRKWVHLEHGAPVQVRLELTTEDEFRRKGKQANVYCVNATKDDPASRLAVFVEGTSENGESFAGWLQSNTENSVFRMNTFVDLSEGGAMIKSRHLLRRWISLKYQNGHGDVVRKDFYTKVD